MTLNDLFRGQRADNSEWFEGSLLKVTIGNKTVHLIFGDDFSFDGNNVEALSHALVNPETVGQYTGYIKDGKKVFVHDVIGLFYDDIIEPIAVGVVKLGEIPKTLHTGFYIDWYGSASMRYRSDLKYWIELKLDREYTKIIGTCFDLPKASGGSNA